MTVVRHHAESSRLAATQVQQLHCALHEQRRFRVDQIADLESAAAGCAGDPGHSEVTATLLQGARLALAEIDAALARAAAGRYGMCTGCGRSIPVERLEILPMVATCMACQRRLESTGPRSQRAIG